MPGKLSFSSKEDVVKFISENKIKILNLCYIPEDGRLKTLSFSAEDRKRVYEILDWGERVDGSNLFSFIEPDKSDIYIVPKLNRVFIHPFSKLPTLNILCDYLDENGKPLNIAPKNVLALAEKKLLSASKVVLKGLAELEFFIISKQETEVLFPSVADKKYHESAPFTKFEDLRNEILVTLENIGVATKYGHTEVGGILGKDRTFMEQHEVEFMPQNLTELAETIAIAKWVIRNLCSRYGVSVSFSPKVDLEHIGNGLHIHLCALRAGKNIIATPEKSLSNDALKIMGGILRFAPSLSAFGNPTPISYLRFIARKEAPMHICWSARNRLALIRIPLWWSFRKTGKESGICRETFEYRAPDPLADAYLLFAGIVLAADYGLSNPEEAIKIARELHVEKKEKSKKLKTLPSCCTDSAKELEKQREFYEADRIFPKVLINKTIEKLKSYRDEELWKKLAGRPNEVEKIIEQFLYLG
jgi:glutamine synthetase